MIKKQPLILAVTIHFKGQRMDIPLILNNNSFPLAQTQFTFVPFIRQLAKIFIFSRLVFLPLLLAVLLCEPRLKLFQTVRRVENRHFVILLSHCASSAPMC